MGFTPNARSEMLRCIVNETLSAWKITHASLHTGDPSTTGANEVSGGSPAYARKALTWNTVGSDGIVELASDVVFDVPASTTITYVGFFSASTSGTFLGSMAVSPSESFGSQGTFTLKAATQLTLS